MQNYIEFIISVGVKFSVCYSGKNIDWICLIEELWGAYSEDQDARENYLLRRLIICLKY
jgi:hypothetical protein